MNRSSPIDLVMFATGSVPMKRVRRMDTSEFPDSEKDMATAMEMAIQAINVFERVENTQIAFFQDGLIIAVEGQTTRKLIWCN